MISELVDDVRVAGDEEWRYDGFKEVKRGR